MKTNVVAVIKAHAIENILHYIIYLAEQQASGENKKMIIFSPLIISTRNTKK